MRKWTTQEDEYLRRNWEYTNDVLAEQLNRSYDAISSRRRTLGLPLPRPEALRKPVYITQAEKEAHIRKLAAEMRIRLLG